MRYIDSAGRTVPAHLALHGGTLRAGFRTADSDVLGDGESIGFEMALRDAAPGGQRVTIHDAAPAYVSPTERLERTIADVHAGHTERMRANDVAVAAAVAATKADRASGRSSAHRVIADSHYQPATSPIAAGSGVTSLDAASASNALRLARYA